MNYFEKRRQEEPLLYAKLPKYLAWLAGSGPILEIGSGWGDFLELARQKKLKAEGIDLDPLRVKACKGQGLNVRQGDALAYIKRLKPGSIKGVFCSNVIEHLTPQQAASLLDSLARILPSGGRIGMATANPRSLELMSEDFWADETHVRPYPAKLLSKMLIARGFKVYRADADEDSRPQSPLRTFVRKFRGLLLGRYFEASEICILAEKTEQISKTKTIS